MNQTFNIGAMVKLSNPNKADWLFINEKKRFPIVGVDGEKYRVGNGAGTKLYTADELKLAIDQTEKIIKPITKYVVMVPQRRR